jgi:hypothetical protein
MQYDGLKTLRDYEGLYNGEWQASAGPNGVDPGMLTNYTQDLFFSMERLSLSPFAIRRLYPVHNGLPFDIPDEVCQNITGQTIAGLLVEGRLFYIDHSAQRHLNKTPDKYVPACDAYFYISHDKGDLMPLAIRSDNEKDLIYTPLDAPNDWLLAKMMFNVNDFFFSQIHHLANTHYVADVVYQAAIRTMSRQHPVLAIISRLLYGTFGIRPLALSALIRPGAYIDQFFGITGEAAKIFANEEYYSGSAGAVRGNYFRENLRRRGLLDSSLGPAIKDFPFLEDVEPIHDAIAKFIGAFVASFYENDAAVFGDKELQAWLVEASGPAQVIDFPNASTMKSRSELVDLLTHIAHLSSTAHHPVNTNQLLTGSATLPFHPTALYRPVPCAKGVEDVVPFLPPKEKALGMINLAANFARPRLADTDRSLVHMFDNATMLAAMNEATRRANVEFMEAMKARSEIVRNREFDAHGLSQGMPFVWKALDPNVAPWSASV